MSVFEPPETQVYEIIGRERPGRWVISCDHASNAVPPEIGGGSLGLTEAEMGRHIAYDLGAAGVTRALADALGAPAVLSRFSRLVIDPNRGENDPTLVMKLYDGTIVPGNRHLDADGRDVRLARYYRPYHAALADVLAARADPVLVAVHSFTPKLVGRRPRPWQIGILHAEDARLAAPFITLLRNDQSFGAWVAEVSGVPLCVGENEPYAGHLPGDAIDRHALQHGRMNMLIELRHDLIATPTQQEDWGTRLAGLLARALHEAPASLQADRAAGTAAQ
ncbi:MAG: N-formylglutamate amidohydrolase [Rhodobacteraceae bacterium]|nr:N-formylglutamate amidohydrolase [Paracoccaceae bacterium]